jgi:hypothetical protein
MFKSAGVGPELIFQGWDAQGAELWAPQSKDVLEGATLLPDDDSQPANYHTSTDTVCYRERE